MATLQSIGKERRKTLQEILKLSRTLDTAQESMERYLKSLTRRKRAYPEISDLSKAMSLYNIMVKESKSLASALQKGFIQ